MPLTDVACRQAKGREKPYKLPDGGGLHLYVTSAGSRLWRWKYRFSGTERLRSFGKYPDMTLTQARELHLEARALLAAGTDPMAERKAEKAADKLTFEGVAKAWYVHWKPARTAAHAGQVWRRLEIDVVPVIGQVPAAELTAAQVRDCVKAIEQRGALDIAKRQLQKVGQIMRYAVAHGNPPAKPQSSEVEFPQRKFDQ